MKVNTIHMIKNLIKKITVKAMIIEGVQNILNKVQEKARTFRLYTFQKMPLLITTDPTTS